MPPTDPQQILHRLKEQTRNCEEKLLDLQTLKFESKEGEMRLYDQSQSYYFKYDPKNPKDPKIIHAAKQFCKLMGVPYSFFSKNPEYMRNNMVSCWLPTLKPEKAQILAKLRKSPDYQVFRAILPVEFTNISNVDVMTQIIDAINDDFRIEFAIGDERDDPILHVRFISNESFEVCGDECSTGFSVVASELGDAPLSVETILFNNESKSAFIASYSGESFFCSNYEGIQPDDMKALFPQLVGHLKSQLPELKITVQSSKELTQTREDTRELMKNLRLKKGLGDKFHTQLYQEMESMSSSDIDRWTFASKIAIIAKDYEAMKRVKIERVAGELIGLSFEKS